MIISLIPKKKIRQRGADAPAIRLRFGNFFFSLNHALEHRNRLRLRHPLTRNDLSSERAKLSTRFCFRGNWWLLVLGDARCDEILKISDHFPFTSVLLIPCEPIKATVGTAGRGVSSAVMAGFVQ
jgi:hypothetical protein